MNSFFRSFRNLNRGSWILIVAFICVSIVMQYDTNRITFEGFFLSLPLVFLMVYWSEQAFSFIQLKEGQFTKHVSFFRDLFLINYSFILGGLLSLLFQYNNSDARGWWPLFLYFNSLIGFLISLVYSIIALVLPTHKIYTTTFSSLFILLMMFIKFWPQRINFLFIKRLESYYVIIFSLLIIHLLYVFVSKLYQILSSRSFN